MYYPHTGEYDTVDFRPLTLDSVGLHPEKLLVWNPARDLPKPRAAMTEQVCSLCDAYLIGLSNSQLPRNA